MYKSWRATEMRSSIRSCSLLTGLERDFHGSASLATAEPLAEVDISRASLEQEGLAGSLAAGWKSLSREKVLRSPEVYQRRMQELGDLNRSEMPRLCRTHWIMWTTVKRQILVADTGAGASK